MFDVGDFELHLYGSRHSLPGVLHRDEHAKCLRPAKCKVCLLQLRALADARVAEVRL